MCFSRLRAFPLKNLLRPRRTAALGLYILTIYYTYILTIFLQYSYNISQIYSYSISGIPLGNFKTIFGYIKTGIEYGVVLNCNQKLGSICSKGVLGVFNALRMNLEFVGTCLMTNPGCPWSIL